MSLVYFERDKKVVLKFCFTFKGYTDKGIKAILVIMLLSRIVYEKLFIFYTP